MSRIFHNVTPGIMIFKVIHLETSDKFFGTISPKVNVYVKSWLISDSRLFSL